MCLHIWLFLNVALNITARTHYSQGKLGFWVGIGTLHGSDFLRWDLKTPTIKNNANLKQKKKNDSDCNFYNSSLLVSCPNKFVVVCICVLIFPGIYSPLPTNIFFYGRLNFFFLDLVARGWEYFKFLGNLLYWRGPNFLFGRGGQGHFFHTVINYQSCKLKNS